MNMSDNMELEIMNSVSQFVVRRSGFDVLNVLPFATNPFAQAMLHNEGRTGAGSIHLLGQGGVYYRTTAVAVIQDLALKSAGDGSSNSDGNFLVETPPWCGPDSTWPLCLASEPRCHVTPPKSGSV